MLSRYVMNFEIVDLFIPSSWGSGDQDPNLDSDATQIGQVVLGRIFGIEIFRASLIPQRQLHSF